MQITIYVEHKDVFEEARRILTIPFGFMFGSEKSIQELGDNQILTVLAKAQLSIRSVVEEQHKGSKRSKLRPEITPPTCDAFCIMWVKSADNVENLSFGNSTLSVDDFRTYLKAHPLMSCALTEGDNNENHI